MLAIYHWQNQKHDSLAMSKTHYFVKEQIEDVKLKDCTSQPMLEGFLVILILQHRRIHQQWF